MWQFHTHQSYTTTEKYLDLLSQALEKAAQNFEPDLLIYNAGTDILDGDPLGRLLVSPDGVKQRDEMVFKFSREKNCPIVMLTSGTLPCQQYYSRFIAGR
jgi:histone deacetylase 11